MQPFDHLDHLRCLRDDPRAMQHFIDRAHRLRAEAYAEAWGWLVGRMRRAFRVAAHRRPLRTVPDPQSDGAKPACRS